MSFKVKAKVFNARHPNQIMEDEFLSLISEAKALNSKVFSLIRMQLLSSLAELGEDGATYRELKATLDLSDGALFSNLKSLEEMRYLKSETVRVENKELESFRITPEGLAQWNRVKDWLYKFIIRGGQMK